MTKLALRERIICFGGPASCKNEFVDATVLDVVSSTDRKTCVCMRDRNATTLSPWSTWGSESSKGQRHNHEILRHRAFITLKIRCDTGRIQRCSLLFLSLSAGRGDEVRVAATYLVFVATADRPRPSQIVIAVLNAWFFSSNTHGASLICVYR